MPLPRLATGLALFAALEAALIAWVDYPAATLAAMAPPWVARVSAPLTRAGEGATSLVPLGLAVLGLAVVGRWRPGLWRHCRPWLAVCAFLFLAVALSGLLVDLIKPLVGRPRPRLYLCCATVAPRPLGSLKAAWQSWPSGHANTLMALALAIGGLRPRWRPALAALACALASTRLWLGMHYPSDILAGFAVAALTTPALHRWFIARGWLGRPPG